jgi:uncharacterized protein involved in exopolysaccharide biosynthesis
VIDDRRMTAGDYLVIARRRAPIVLLAVVLAAGSAYFFSTRQTRIHEASSQVLLTPVVGIGPSAGGTQADTQAR